MKSKFLKTVLSDYVPTYLGLGPPSDPQTVFCCTSDSIIATLVLQMIAGTMSIIITGSWNNISLYCTANNNYDATTRSSRWFCKKHKAVTEQFIPVWTM